MSKFSHDSDLANVLWSSGLLSKACNAICDTRDQDPLSSISINVIETPDIKIIVFRSSPGCSVQSLEEAEVITPSNENLFEFISPKVNPDIAINKIALDVFVANFEDLHRHQDQIIITKPLLVTGNSLGGSIASLFTLFLLDTTYNTKTLVRPICITFGSPLLGDAGLKKAIYQKSSWPSCFVHVTLSHDPITMLFGSPKYEPFGIYFFCSESGFSCINQPEYVKEVMVALRSVRDLDLSGIMIDDYRDWLVAQKISKGISKLNDLNVDLNVDSLKLGITLELQAIGVLQMQEEVNNDVKGLIEKIKKTKEKGIIRKQNVMDEKKELNKTKIIMNDLEWYKKATIDDGGYYDGYKKQNSIDKRKSKVWINKNNSILEKYWGKKVGEAKEKPQKEAVSFRNSWLFAGTNYRRMVEPLHIAEHYLSGKTDYVRTARPEHFILLEKWFNDDKKTEKHTTAASLTEDSCFWARVEEAVISLNVLTRIQSLDVDKYYAAVIELNGFEDYVMRMIEGYAVSPEIFLPKSTFMKWWEEYKQYKDGATIGGYTSPLADFMMNKRQLYK
jgi:hypothetical protein